MKTQLVFMILLTMVLTSCNDATPEYLNESLSFEERVNDLVSRMTLEEKIEQMRYDAPANERLGIPAYNWWNECLHGVARTGKATVFPQAIGLAATWDKALIFDIATIISDEARGKYHEYIRNDKHGIYQGLTFWTPNINIFRDPRWGRGMETYGEDPYLTAQIALPFIKGIQGDDSKYYKAIATAKHFAVHSGPEPLRHSFNADVSEQDLYETYLPQFRDCIIEGKVESVMCAYNLYKQNPCCGSRFLLEEVLRKKWGFNGYVVSDCWALSDFYNFQTTAKDSPEAGAIALKAGTDLNCGIVFRDLKQAVDSNLVDEEFVNTAITRLMMARFKLGMFDNQKNVPWSTIPVSILDEKSHQEAALNAAQASMVLLKNEDNTLPLKKNIKSIAVIGPNAHNAEVMFANYNGTPAAAVTPFEGIKKRAGEAITVNYAQGCDWAENMPFMERIPEQFLFTDESCTTRGLTGKYYANSALEGTPKHIRNDEVIDFNWWDKAPFEDLDGDNFSVEWTGFLVPPATGIYYIGCYGTEYEVYLEDSLMAQRAEPHGTFPFYKKIQLEGGKKYAIRALHMEKDGESEVRLIWGRTDIDKEKEAIDMAKQSDQVVLVMGLSPWLEGEQMDVEVEGFLGGDRTSLDLPEMQRSFIKKIYDANPNVVLVLMNGSALSINWCDEHLPAILEAWYPGQDGGTAVANILFGDYNPSGRLPVTFYTSTHELPPFDDYNMQGRTYKYYEGNPLYPFGYGLSYTSFEYSDLLLKQKDSTLSVEFKLKNNGSYDGEEVCQVYAGFNEPKPFYPLRKLVAFEKVLLKAGEEKQIQISIPLKNIAMADETGEYVISEEAYAISVGGGQPLKGFHTRNHFITTTTRIKAIHR